MGVELRSIQRKFHNLMGEVNPQIVPRFVVWLDERLAEFKIRGRMETTETLEDPQWIKDFYASKRASKVAAIKEREARNMSDTPSSYIQPKVEEKSESSNGNAHPDELIEAKIEENPKSWKGTEQTKEVQPEKTETGERTPDDVAFSLVEVKRETLEDDDDDDMIITGESIVPIAKPFQSTYNPMKHMYSRRTVGPFQRKRQRFGSFQQQRAFKSQRMKPNFRSSSTNLGNQSLPIPSHTVTSETMYGAPSPHSQSFSDTSQYQMTDTQALGDNELLQIPPHLQSEIEQGQLDYQVTESVMYNEYGEESYDSSYAGDESSILYDEDGNAVLQGEYQRGDGSMEPLPGTSGATTTAGLRKVNANKYAECVLCGKSYNVKSLQRHISTVHMDIRNFTCYCGKTFKQRSHMLGHQNSNTSCMRIYSHAST